MKSGETDATKADERDEKPAGGVTCPKCGCGHCPVWYTRAKPNGVVRKRICRHCGKEFITVETTRG
jgi:hypothetical protein